MERLDRAPGPPSSTPASQNLAAVARGAVFTAVALGIAGLAVRVGGPAAPEALPGVSMIAGFLLAGGGLRSAAAPRRALLAGTLVAACGLGVLVEHGASGVGWSLHHAPCTVTKALCLILTGAAIVLLRRRTALASAVPSGFMGAATASLGLGELAGHFIEKLLIGDAGSSALALWSFGGLAGLGAGTVARAGLEAGIELKARAPRWLAMAVATFVAVGALGLWQAMRTLEERRVESLTTREVAAVAARIEQRSERGAGELPAEWLKAILEDSRAHGFAGAVYTGDELVAGDASGGRVEQTWARSKTLTLRTRRWTVRVWPTARLLRGELTAIPGATLAVGLAIACLVGLSIDRSGTAGYRERKFKAFLEAAPHAWVTVDGGGRIVQVNAQAEKLFGYRRDELIGEPVEILVPERFRATHPEHRREYARNPLPRPMGAGRILHARRKDGAEVPVEISLSPVATDEGLLVLTAVVDVSHRIETAQKLTSLNEDLERKVAERTAALERRARELERVNAELERFNRLAVGREHRMIALKREVNEMSFRLTEEPRYDLSFLSEE